MYIGKSKQSGERSKIQERENMHRRRVELLEKKTEIEPSVNRARYKKERKYAQEEHKTIGKEMGNLGHQ